MMVYFLRIYVFERWKVIFVIFISENLNMKEGSSKKFVDYVYMIVINVNFNKNLCYE